MKVTVILLCVTACFLSRCEVESSKILGIFHFPSKSHHILGRSLLKALAKHGHQVTMVSPFPEKKPIANYTDIELTGLLDLKEEMGVMFANQSSKILQIYNGFTVMPKICRHIVHHPSFMKLANSGEKFDVAIMFSAFFEPLLGYVDKMGVPVIGFSPIGSNFITAYHTMNSMPYSYVPHAMLSFTDKMTFFERVLNTVANVAWEIMWTMVVTPFQERLYKEVYPDGKPLKDLIQEVDLYLMNSHFSTETSRPYLPNMIQIGGFHMYDDEEIPKDLKKYLDDAKEGVVYVCFGTNVNAQMFSTYQKQAILKTLGKLKMKAVWKFEEDVEPKPANVRIEKWLPQKSILAHPNVKLFISHGGMGGLSETIYFGVPVVAIPFFGDQQANVEGLIKKGYGVKVLKDDLTEENLEKAVKEVLTNKVYRENINKQSVLYREQPVNPMEKAIFWVEHVIKHKGAKHLRPQSKMLPLYQYYLLDVIAFLAGIVITSLAVTYFVTKKILKCFCRMLFSTKKTKTTKIKSN